MTVTEQAAEHQLSIVPAKTDKDMADEFREKLAPLLKEVCLQMDVARQHGMKIDIGLNPNAFGTHQPFIMITKAL